MSHSTRKNRSIRGGKSAIIAKLAKLLGFNKDRFRKLLIIAPFGAALLFGSMGYVGQANAATTNIDITSSSALEVNLSTTNDVQVIGKDPLSGTNYYTGAGILYGTISGDGTNTLEWNTTGATWGTITSLTLGTGTQTMTLSAFETIDGNNSNLTIGHKGSTIVANTITDVAVLSNDGTIGSTTSATNISVINLYNRAYAKIYGDTVNASTITNYADGTLNADKIITTGTLYNTGTIEVSGTDGISAGNAITNGQYSTLNATKITTSDTLTNLGFISSADNRAAIEASAVTNSGTLYATTVKSTGAVTNKNYGLINATGDIIVTTGNISNTSSNPTGMSAANITAQNGNIINGDSGVTTVTSQMTATGAITANGSLENNYGNIQASTITTTGTLFNIGTINVTGDDGISAGGAITNSDDGKITAVKIVTTGTNTGITNYLNATINISSELTATGALENHGKILGNSNTAVSADTITNYGFGVIEAATVTATNALTNSGRIGIESNYTIRAAVTGASVSNEGVIYATTINATGIDTGTGTITNHNNFGYINATGDITAEQGIINKNHARIKTTGDIISLSGNISNTSNSVAVSGESQSGYLSAANITAQDGNIVNGISGVTSKMTATGNITAGGTGNNGNITNRTNSIMTAAGDIVANNTVYNYGSMTGSNIKANEDAINNWGTMSASDSISANGNLVNSGTIKKNNADDTLAVSGNTITNEANASIQASSVTASTTFNNRGTIGNNDNDANRTAIKGNVTNYETGIIYATTVDAISTGQSVSNSGIMDAIGAITANNNVTNSSTDSMTGASITATNGYVLNTAGTMTANDANGTGITAGTGIYNAATNTGIMGAGTMNSAAAIKTATGNIVNNTNGDGMVGTSITATTGSVTNVKGRMQATSATGITAGNGSVTNSDTMVSAGVISATNGNVTNKENATMDAEGAITATNGNVVNDGTFTAQSVTATGNDTTGKVTNGVATGNGTMIVTGAITADSDVTNSSDETVTTDTGENSVEAASITAGGSVTNNAGVMRSAGNVQAGNDVENNGTLIAANIVADSDGTGAGGVTNETDAIMTGDSVTGQFLTNSGALTSNDDVDIVGAMTNNEGATWTANGDVIGGSLLNSGLINGTDNFTVDTGNLSNNGILNAGGNIALTEGDFTNEGSVTAKKVTAQNITNSGTVNVRIYNAGVGDATPDDNDFYSASDTVTIDGGTLVLKDATGGQAFVEGDKYTIFHAGDGLTVDEDMTLDASDMTLGRRMKFTTSYNQLNYYAEVAAKWSYGKDEPTYNLQQFGAYLDNVTDHVVDGSDLDDVLTALEGTLDNDTVTDATRYAMTQMDGAIYGSMATMEIQNMTIVNSTLANYLRPKSVFDNGTFCDPDSHLNLWGNYYGVDGYVKDDGNAFGGDYSVNGVLVGADRCMTPNLRLGGFFAFGNTKYQVNGLDEQANADSYKAGLYVVRSTKSGYLFGNFNYGWDNFRMSRNITFLNRAHSAETSGSEWAMRIEKGLNYALGDTLVQPFGAFQFLSLDTAAFNESGEGATALNVDQSDYDSYRSEIGARLLRGYEGNHGGLSNLYLQASWMHEYGDSYGTVTSAFNNAGGVNYSGNAKYTVHGVDLGRDWCDMGFGGDWNRNNFTVYGGYDFLFSGTQNLHTGSIGMAYQF